jgi:hypothetical protein
LKAKKLIVEAKFFGEGKRQFSFSVSGLTWPPKDAPDNSRPLEWCEKKAEVCADKETCETMAGLDRTTCVLLGRLWCFPGPMGPVCRKSSAACDAHRAAIIKEGRTAGGPCLEMTQATP